MKNIFFIFYFLNCFFCNGQLLKTNNFAIGVSLFNGYNVASNRIDRTSESLDGFANGFQIDILKQVNGTKDWHKTYGMPRIGISFQTIFMNKPDTFGMNFSVLPFVQFRLLKFKNADFNGKLAIGGAYVTKVFKQATNFDNRAISIPYNFGLEVAAIYNKKLSKHFDLSLEAGFFHISNGSFVLPNGGINIYYLKSGINYFFNDVPYNRRTSYEMTSNNNKWYYTTYLAGAYREQGTFAYRRQFPIFTFHQAVMKPINKIYSLGIGADLFYDASQALINEPNLLASQVKENDKWLVSLGFCNELSIGKLGIPLEFYHYIYDMQVVKQVVYLRFGVTYYPYKKMYIGCYFKGSNNKYNTLGSDFMEFAFGWKFRTLN